MLPGLNNAPAESPTLKETRSVWRRVTDAILGRLASTASAADGSGMVGNDQTKTYTPTSLGFMINRQRRWNPCGYPWLCKFDGSTDDTAAIIQCLTDIYNAGGGVMVCPPGVCRLSSLVFNYAASISVSIEGAGQHATYFQKIGATTTPVIDLSSPNTVMDVASHYTDFSVIGSLTAGGSSIGSCNGIRLTNLANFVMELIEVRQSQVCFDLAGTLVATFNRCSPATSQTGFKTRLANGVYCNSLTFNDPQVRDCHTLGWDIGDAMDFLVKGGNTEICGTTGNTATGGASILATVDDEVGYSSHKWQTHHFEANYGRSMQVANAGGLILGLDGVTLLASESGRALNVGAISKIDINRMTAGSVGDTVTLAATTSKVTNSIIDTLTDTSTNKFRQNVTTSGGLQADLIDAPNGLSITQGNLSFETIGKGLKLKTGTNAVMGFTAMVAGVAVINTTAVAANSLILYCANGQGGAPGWHRETARVPGTSFTISSSSVTDTSTVGWMIVNQS